MLIVGMSNLVEVRVAEALVEGLTVEGEGYVS